MSVESTRPTTIHGIKRLAKKLGRRDDIRHTAALELAAQLAGFQNFHQARRQLVPRQDPPAVPATHAAYISVDWFRARGDHGKEVLVVPLTVPLADLVTRSQLRVAGYLWRFTFAGADHLAIAEHQRDQADARRLAGTVARMLTFMDATGLKPSSSRRKVLPKGKSGNVLPGLDHETKWFHPESGTHVLVDEPYPLSAARSAERAAWAQHHQWQIVETAWSGMHPVDGTLMFLLAEQGGGFDLAKAVAKLDRLPRPSKEAWDGSAAEFRDKLVTPGGRYLPPLPKRPPSTKPRAKSGPVETYQTRESKIERRRPLAAMPIASHAEVGKLLCPVLDKDLPLRPYRRLSDIRSELRDWALLEYDQDQLPGATVSFYYHGPAQPDLDAMFNPEPIDPVIAAGQLERIKAVLSEHYHDCAPLRSVLGGLDKVIRKLGN